MAKSGPIIIIDDDIDDRGILEDVIKDLNIDNPLIFFGNSRNAFDYLKTTADQPFIILCDVNLPGQNGVEFKRQIDNDKQLRKKSIPFVFYSTSVSQTAVNVAYTEMTVQGFFKKNDRYDEIKKDIKLILDYWQVCKHPNLQ